MARIYGHLASVKKLLPILLIGILLVGALIAWKGYNYLTKELPYGVAVPYPAQSEEQQEYLEKVFNEFIDQEEVLQPIVESVDVAKLTGTQDQKAQIQALAEKSTVLFDDAETLHFTVSGSRLQREAQMKVAKKLQEAWLAELKKELEAQGLR